MQSTLLRRNIGIAAAVLALGLWFSSGRVTGAVAFGVKVDGSRVAVVLGRSEREVKQLVDSVCQRVVAEAASREGVPVTIMSQIEVEQLPRGEGVSAALEQGELERKIADLVRLGGQGWAIKVDDNPVVALRTEEEAKDVITEVQAVLGRAASANFDDAQVMISETRFKQRVEIEERAVPLSLFQDKETAKRILIRGTDRVAVHVVQRGQTLWDIARRHNLTVAQLRAANPQLKSDRLQIGDQLNVIDSEPLVTCQTQSLITYRASVPYPTQVVMDEDMWPWQVVVRQKGVPGVKQVTAEVVIENGREISRRIIEEEVLSDPVPQVEVHGAKQIPARGSGDFAWPVVGTITSGYGWRRSGYHHGVDIGCDIGTPVVAADSGVVTFSGYKAYYGEMVIIDHGQGKIVTVYGHLSRRLVSTGQAVEKGQVIGYSGRTGRATGPHLHFEVRVDGETVDPMRFYGD